MELGLQVSLYVEFVLLSFIRKGRFSFVWSSQELCRRVCVQKSRRTVEKSERVKRIHSKGNWDIWSVSDRYFSWLFGLVHVAVVLFMTDVVHVAVVVLQQVRFMLLLCFVQHVLFMLLCALYYRFWSCCCFAFCNRCCSCCCCAFHNRHRFYCFCY